MLGYETVLNNNVIIVLKYSVQSLSVFLHVSIRCVKFTPIRPIISVHGKRKVSGLVSKDIFEGPWITEARCQRPDVRCQRPDVSGQMSEARCQRPDVIGQMGINTLENALRDASA